MPNLILIDGSSYLYRAYHALPPLVNSQGMPTGAIYGVLSMLRKLILAYPEAHIGVVFDAKGPTFRNTLYPEYKAHRPPMPSELRQQIDPLFQLIDNMGLPRLVIPGVEADDVMASLAIQAKEAGWSVLISTSDKDMAQLVSPEITLENTMTQQRLDRDGVMAKFGLPPEQIRDYLTLIGDSADNVPGVKGVGPKTAVKWLQTYGSLENLMESATTIKGKVGDNLREALPLLPLSQTLITLKTDLDLGIQLNELVRKPSDDIALNLQYQALEFFSLLKEKGTSPTPAPLIKSYEIILTPSQWEKCLNELKMAPYFAFDTETTGLDPLKAQLVGLSFSLSPGKAVYLPLNHDYLGAPPQLNQEKILRDLKPIFENPQILKVGHHLKFDRLILDRVGIQVQGDCFDTLLEAFIVGKNQRYDLVSLAKNCFQETALPFEAIAGKGVKQLTFNQIDIEKAGEYAAEDADLTLRLHHYFWPQIEANPALKSAFETIEMPLVPILTQIEKQGVLIDCEQLRAQSQALAMRLAELEEKAHDLGGESFNLNSPKQLQTLLFEKLGLPIIEKTPTGQASTSEEVLQELAPLYPLAALILEYRHLSKLKSTYTDKLPLQVNSETGRVHTSYHQVGAATGRFSSSDPNLQNIPIRTETGRQIRQAFIAPPGYTLVAADYSQIELRIMAHLSQDPGLLAAFNAGLDIHTATAAQVFNVPLDQVNSDQRRSAKAVNFGLIYGMSAFGLAKQLGVDRHTAQAYIDSYFARYPGVHHFMETIREKAHQQGYVETLVGRRLYLNEINARQVNKQRAAERAAINAPMQGTAADIIKKAMILVDQMIHQTGLDAHIILQVHDELVLEVKNDCVNTLIPRLKDAMEQATQLTVPLVVDIGTGPNWDATK